MSEEPERPKRDSSFDRIDLDPAEAARRKAQRDYRLNVVQYPLSRLIGNSLVTLAAVVHNLYVLESFSWGGSLQIAGVLLGYSLVSWLILRLLYARVTTVDLGTLFMLGDVLVWTFVIYLTGGERSWLFFLVMVRVADQLYTSFKRVLFFAHFSPLCYGLMLLLLDQVEGRPIPWRAEAAKIYFLYSVSLYMSLTARTAEALRRRTTQAIRVARELIRELEDKSRQLEEARVRAEGASRAKSAFLANMSHELRTPLNAIIGYSEILREEVRTGREADVLADLQRIHASGVHLLALIDDVLDLSRIEDGRMELHPRIFDVGALVERVVTSVAPLRERNANTLEVRHTPDLGSMHADEARVRQVLFNVLSNAAKFTEKGAITFSITRETEGDGDWVCFRVADTGIGIGPEQVGSLFQAFSQGDPSSTRRYGGSGLGLVLSRRFCQMMGGDIAVMSELGKGSAFTVRLPGRTPDSARSG